MILEVAGCPWDVRPVGRTSPPDAFSRVAVFGDPASVVRADGTTAAEAELPTAEPPQQVDDWTDIANTPITASGRRLYITDAMVKKFGVTMGCPRYHNGQARTQMHAERVYSATWRRRPQSPHQDLQQTWQSTVRSLGLEARSEIVKTEEEMQS